MFSFCLQTPVAYPGLLWVAQGLSSWSSFRESSSTASAGSKKGVKAHPVLVQIPEAMREHMPFSAAIKTHTSTGHALEINCCQALKADVSPKMSCCITFDIQVRFTITELVQLFSQEIYWSNNILIFQIFKLCFLLCWKFLYKSK